VTERMNKDSYPELATLADQPSRANLSEATESERYRRLVDQFDDFKASVRLGEMGKTAQFWIRYCDCVWILLGFQHAVKENNLTIFITYLRQMCGLLFSADHLSYARYLPVYYSQLMNLSESHPGAERLLEDGGFSIARSDVPGCRVAVDQTIEQTINRSAKTSGGIVGFSRNTGAYYRWCLTRHSRAAYVEATLDNVDMLDNHTDAHKSTLPAERKRSEKEVNEVIATFSHFVNPFAAEGQDQMSCFACRQVNLHRRRLRMI